MSDNTIIKFKDEEEDLQKASDVISKKTSAVVEILELLHNKGFSYEDWDFINVCLNDILSHQRRYLGKDVVIIGNNSAADV